MKFVFFNILLIGLFMPAKADDGLPLKVMPARPSSAPLVFMISGDGGWNNFIQSVSDCLTQKGMPVVGLDSKKYFWKSKDPDQSAAEFNSAIARYMKALGRKSYILVGYSFGACIVPFIANRTPATLKPQLTGVYSISPDERGDFEIHLTDMLSMGTVRGKYDVVAEMGKIKVMQPLCIFGSDEKKSVSKRFTQAGIKSLVLKGDHHYNENYCLLAESIARNEGVIK